MSRSGVFALFAHTSGGWYRPVASLAWVAQARLFGTQATPAHWLAWVAYVAVATLVGVVAGQLTGDRFVAGLAAGVFAISAVHAEPVLWLAASNELLAALPLLLTAVCFLAYRRGARPCGPLTVALFLLALCAKEVAVWLPLWLAVVDVTRGDGRRLTSVTITTLAAAFLFAALRIVGGSPYPLLPALPRVPVNALYYVAVGVAGVPEHYGYASELGLWRAAPGLPVATVALTAFGWLLLLRGARRGDGLGARHDALMLASAWSLCAVLPVLLTATGRTWFEASMGIAMLVAVLARGARPPTAAAALACLVGANLLLVRDRTEAWRASGGVMTAVVGQVEAIARAHPTEVICLAHLPDHLAHAYIFRNAFPALADVWSPATVLPVAATPSEACGLVCEEAPTTARRQRAVVACGTQRPTAPSR